MNITSTNAPDMYDSDGDFVGYALPDADPVSIDTKFVTSFRRCDDGVENVDDMLYRVEWANGVWAEMVSLPNGWHDIYLASVSDRQRKAFVRLDAAIAEAAKPVSIHETPVQNRSAA